jgi:hypothetical protein
LTPIEFETIMKDPAYLAAQRNESTKGSAFPTAIVALASEITAWAGLLAHPEHEARRWEPKRLRHRILTIPATIARHGRRTILHLSNRSRWVVIVLAPIKSLRALPAPSR